MPNLPHKSENDENSIIKNHAVETHTAFGDDMEALKTALAARYPSPESAVEDYRKGYVQVDKLRIRFTNEEVEYILKEKEKRDEDEAAWSSSNVL